MDHIALQARLQPDRLALRDLISDRRWSYAELDRYTAQCAGLLSGEYGLSEGDRLVVIAKNSAELVVLHAACARLGLVYVPLNWRLSGTELDWLVNDADPALLIGDETMATVTSAVNRQLISDVKAAIAASKPLNIPATNRVRPSLILYTSGTSGKPKGALLSEHNLDQTAHNFSILGRVTHKSVFLCDSPMFHIIGLITNVRPTFMRGAALLISDGFDPARTLARMADPDLKVSHYFGVPQMAQMLRREPSYDPEKLRGLTGIFTGGAPHPAANIRAWLKDGIAVIDGFGMSEAGTVFGMPIELDAIDRKAGSVGIGTPAIQARIVDASGNDLPAGQSGELLLRGDNVTCGYWRRPEATEDSFTDDGWFKTGDIALQDEDGFYYLVDRKKDMFISGGENVFPAEVEAALAGMPGLKEAAIIGIPHEKWGEVGHLAAVADPDITFDMAQVEEWLQSKLAKYKLPKTLSLHDALPRTGSGKIQKNILKEMIIP